MGETVSDIGTLLRPEDIDQFRREGVLVIKNFLTNDEVADARKGLHEYLLTRGINHSDLDRTAQKLAELSSTGGSGGVIDAFYQDWKLTLNENPKAVKIMSQLWGATFASCEAPFEHPFGNFNSEQPLMYIDRVCYRIPDRISELHCSDAKKKRFLQRSLTPHIDCCPHRMFQDIGEYKYSKWRPIQAFIALTDTESRNMGGFEACPGFHAEFDEWTKKRIPNPPLLKKITVQKSRLESQCRKRNQESESCDVNASMTELNHDIGKPIVGINDETEVVEKNNQHREPPCVGQFTPIRMIEDNDIIKRFEHISCRAGDMVVWDYRIPHSNSYKNESHQTREALYIGLLPNTELNRDYIKDQLVRYGDGVVPIDQWHSHNEPQLCNYSFSELGKKMMGIDPW